MGNTSICMGNTLARRLAQRPLWDPRHLFEIFSFHPLAGPIFHRSIQLALSFNHSFLVCIAYLISFVSYQCLIKNSITFQKLSFAPPAPLRERQEGHLLPSAPLSSVPVYNKHISEV